LLLLRAARIGVCPVDAASSDPVPDRCLAKLAVEAGLLLVVECVREGECSADSLQRKLLLEEQADGGTTGVGLALKRWHNLVPAFARALDVFQPPPGTSPKATAKVAINTAIDFLVVVLQAEGSTKLTLKSKEIQAVLDEQDDATLVQNVVDRCFSATSAAAQSEASLPDDPICEYLSGIGPKLAAKEIRSRLSGLVEDPKGAAAGGVSLDYLQALRELVNAVSDDEPERAARAAGSMLASAILKATERECQSTGALIGSCKLAVPVTSAQVQKAFGMVNGILAYASTYKPSEGAEHAELDKAILEERKRAMNDLVDSATERSDRADDLVVSFGTGVGVGYGWYRQREQSDPNADRSLNGPGLLLPTGVAIEWLPSGFHGFWGPLGVNVQFTALDLSLYAAAPEGEGVEPEPATAVFPGLRAGVLFGEPDMSLLLGGGIGYAPRARFDENGNVGMLRYELFVGTYIPFIDLN
jgi:hypothetical protein